MKSEDTVIQHVTNVQKLASQLKDAGHEVTEMDIMAKILGSLPAKYSMLSTAWDSVPVADQTVGVLLERLIKEESRLTADDSAANALAAVKFCDKKKGARSDKDTHFKERSDRQGKMAVECYYCKKKGHFARDCHKQKRDKKFEKERTNNENSAFIITSSRSKRFELNSFESAQSSGEVQNMMARDMKDIWITDSGASCHMTYRREWLTDYKSVVGEMVSLGNDKQCNVSGKGTVLIKRFINGHWEEGKLEDVLLVPQIKKKFVFGGCVHKKRFLCQFQRTKCCIKERQ